jgi:hypothetical protein
MRLIETRGRKSRNPQARMHRRSLLKGLTALPLLTLPAPAWPTLAQWQKLNASWQHAFGGSHYPRLRALKPKYDPDGLFFVHHGVGSEDWRANGFTRIA